VRTKSAHTVPYTNTVLADVSGKMLPMRLAQMPLIRDVGTYLLSLGLTVWFINDSRMTTVESSISLVSTSFTWWSLWLERSTGVRTRVRVRNPSR